MSAESSKLSFPHPVLTPIVGAPTNKTNRLLKREVYANALDIHSTIGSGMNGHLGLVMPPATYLACAGVAWADPAHPGGLPVHPQGATGHQITEANRQYDANLVVHARFITVREELKKQIQAAVELRFLTTLEDADFGFADVTPEEMLLHLEVTYGTVTPDDIEANREGLSKEWNVDEPLENLWLRIHEAQQFATTAGEPITKATAIRLTLFAIEKTGISPMPSTSGVTRM